MGWANITAALEHTADIREIVRMLTMDGMTRAVLHQSSFVAKVPGWVFIDSLVQEPVVIGQKVKTQVTSQIQTNSTSAVYIAVYIAVRKKM